MPNVIEALEERGFIESTTSKDLKNLVKEPIKLYCGFDPTADSLHLGNLVGIMMLAWFQKFGHTPVAIIGGATGMIGDPSGRKGERQLLKNEDILKNMVGIRKNLETVLDFHASKAPAMILNNLDWYKDVSFIDFLREIGTLFRVGQMLAKESVKLRLQSEEGISFTEMSYQMLQGYDFLHLYEHYHVSLQIGGSDQWGNITAGTDLIRKVLSKTAHGLTFPLLTKSDGQKFGKSESGAIWLSPEKLSSYEFYQYLLRTEDADVIKLMRMLTFMSMEEIREYEKRMQEPGYVPRTAQKRLADEVTHLIHGESGLKQALKITEGISPGSQTVLDVEMLESLAKEMASSLLKREEVVGCSVIDILVKINLQSSKSEARRTLEGGGGYLNNKQIEQKDKKIETEDLIGNRFLLFAVGKKNKKIVQIVD